MFDGFKMALIFALLLVVPGCDSPTSPRSGTATATATCGQNGAGVLSIFCQDQSSDPQSVVVENGVRFEFSPIGSAFQASRLVSIGAQAIVDVTGGGFGTYIVNQELRDDQGVIVASESYSIPVVSAADVAAVAVRLGFVARADEQRFRKSLRADPFGENAVLSGLLSVNDAMEFGAMVFEGRIGL